MLFYNYWELFQISLNYAQDRGRLPMCYSPVCHVVKNNIQLACLKHAASVHPEPGSNSHIKYCLTTKKFKIV